MSDDDETSFSAAETDGKAAFSPDRARVAIIAAIIILGIALAVAYGCAPHNGEVAKSTLPGDAYIGDVDSWSGERTFDRLLEAADGNELTENNDYGDAEYFVSFVDDETSGYIESWADREAGEAVGERVTLGDVFGYNDTVTQVGDGLTFLVTGTYSGITDSYDVDASISFKFTVLSRDKRKFALYDFKFDGCNATRWEDRVSSSPSTTKAASGTSSTSKSMAAKGAGDLIGSATLSDGSTLYTYDDGSCEYTDGYGNVVRDVDGDGVVDKVSTDGGISWSNY